MTIALDDTVKTYIKNKTEWEPITGCLLWAYSTDSSGYGCAWVDKRVVGAHRVAWTCEHGPIPSDLQVCHKCDTPACCNTKHMFLGTHTDNMRDRSRKKRFDISGTKNGRARLSETDVRIIVASTDKTRILAERFGVGMSHIRQIQRGLAWIGPRPKKSD